MVSSLTAVMHKWLAKVNPHLEGRYTSPKTPGLPDPNTTVSTNTSTDIAKMVGPFESMNVDEAVLKASISRMSKKYGRYFDYNEEMH